MSGYDPLKPAGHGPCGHEHLTAQQASDLSMELAVVLGKEVGAFCAEATRCRAERAVLAISAMSIIVAELYQAYEGTAVPAITRDAFARRLSWSITVH